LLEIKTGLEIELNSPPQKALSTEADEKNLDPEAINVLNQLDFAPTSLEDIAAHSNLTIELVLSKLLQLELAGKISPLPGGQYQKIQN